MESKDAWLDVYGMNQDEYDRKFRCKSQSSIQRRVKDFIHRLLLPFLSLSNFWRLFTSFVPIFRWLPDYKWKEDLLYDTVGGLTTGISHILQGLAFAVVIGVDPIYGLYASLFPVIFYMLFGTSRHVSIGAFAVTAIMSGVAVDKIATQYSQLNATLFDNYTLPSASNIEIATALTFTTGVIETIAGILQLEFITTYFSDQLVSGFTTGSAVHVVVGQLDTFLGIRVPKFYGLGYVFKRLYHIIIRIPQTNLYTLGLSIFSTIFLYFGKKCVTPFMEKVLPFDTPIPHELLVATVVGEIPAILLYFSLPEPQLPRFDLVGICFPYAMGIAAVVIAVHISMAKMLAKQKHYSIDSEQELYALGFSTVLGSFFPIYPVATSLGRTMVNVESGSRTQFASVPSCLLIVAVILWVGPLLNALPMCILAVILLMSLRTMFYRFAELPKIWPVSKIDFLIWVVSFVATVAADVMDGLVIAVIFAMLTLLFRSQWPRWRRLGQLSPHHPYFDNPKRYAAATSNPNFCIYRFECPLLFNNVGRFKTSIHDALLEWQKETSILANMIITVLVTNS
ncbi:unnamed protein product [Thelazia callipaeda]|uniref:Sulfate_transp domain-containing protein n=1 Tax=Thelazia callipaeda TaxID=103827 RepID=A0A0N5CJ36_THECL|nr:unnamed protein product [Thelazia callipaeda]